MAAGSFYAVEHHDILMSSKTLREFKHMSNINARGGGPDQEQCYPAIY